MPNYHDYLLRPLTSSDLELVLSWRNSERIRENMYTDHVISWDEHHAWYEKIKDDSTVNYLICEFKDKPIGLVCFTDINNQHNRCYWGFYLGEPNAPLGSGTAMEFLALDFVFGSLDIRKLCCEVLSFNEKVIKLHKKFHFHQEGIYSKHVYKNSEYRDVICLSLFKDEWLLHREDLRKKIFK